MGSLKTSDLQVAIERALWKQRNEKDAGTAVSTIAKELATAIEAFVTSGEVAFESGKVKGNAPPGTAGGPITAGSASGGKIS